MRLFLFLGLALTLLACARPTEEVEDRSSRPNILLIVADDLGYTDLGSYGSEIHTPTLDQLAAQGVRFRRFHTYPTCAPTRAALLAGTDNHVAGVDSQLRESDGWGYEGHLTDRVVPIPRVLSEAGYHTYTTGKWHLGHEDGQRPAQKGFERTFVLHQGAANHYTDTGFVSADRPSTYSSNGTRVEWPDGEYSTEVYTDSLMEYIGEPKGDPRPFFAYAAYTSPHWPLQGGVVPPMIDSGSGLDGQGTIVDAFAMVTDVAPTLYDIAGVSPPSACNDSARYPLQGVSLAPVLSGTSDRVHPAAEAWVMEQAGHVRVRKGQWKLVRKGTWRLVDPDEDWSISDFALYNLTNDRAEQTDLRSERPEKFRKLLGEWRTYREKYKVRDSF